MPRSTSSLLRPYAERIRGARGPAEEFGRCGNVPDGGCSILSKQTLGDERIHQGIAVKLRSRRRWVRPFSTTMSHSRADGDGPRRARKLQREGRGRAQRLREGGRETLWRATVGPTTRPLRLLTLTAEIRLGGAASHPSSQPGTSDVVSARHPWFRTRRRCRSWWQRPMLYHGRPPEASRRHFTVLAEQTVAADQERLLDCWMDFRARRHPVGASRQPAPLARLRIDPPVRAGPPPSRLVDPETGEWSWLAASAPNRVTPRAEVHPTVEEAFLIRGDCLLGEHGEMTPGCYFWRPAMVKHGPLTTRNGTFFFFRTKGGGLETTYHDVPGWEEAVRDYRAAEPYFRGDV